MNHVIVAVERVAWPAGRSCTRQLPRSAANSEGPGLSLPPKGTAHPPHFHRHCMVRLGASTFATLCLGPRSGGWVEEWTSIFLSSPGGGSHRRSDPQDKNDPVHRYARFARNAVWPALRKRGNRHHQSRIVLGVAGDRRLAASASSIVIKAGRSSYSMRASFLRRRGARDSIVSAANREKWTVRHIATSSTAKKTGSSPENRG